MGKNEDPNVLVFVAVEVQKLRQYFLRQARAV